VRSSPTRPRLADDTGFPSVQKIVWDLRGVLGPDDIVISDVKRAQEMWMSRIWPARRAA
jgi:thiamine pyrophosphate-dependent acetolactate synthase large subunit-like protein